MSSAGAHSCIVAFVLVLLLAPVVKATCTRWQILDWPGPLKIHQEPIPRLGGIAVVFAFAGAIFVSRAHLGRSGWAFLIALSLVGATGFFDDLRGLSPIVRLATQIFAAFILWLAGCRLPFSGPSALGIAALCFYVVLFVNAFNFLDGADGIATGVATIIAIAYASLPSHAKGSLPLVLAWSLAGACAAFLLFNLPRASLYLGDAGSTTLGLVVAFLGLLFYRSSPVGTASLSFPFLVAGLPLFDAVLAILRRLNNHRSPLHGDRRHVYDLLLARGMTQSNVTIVCYAITAVLVMVARFGLNVKPHAFEWGCATALSALLAFMLGLGALRTDKKERPAEMRRVEVE